VPSYGFHKVALLPANEQVKVPLLEPLPKLRLVLCEHVLFSYLIKIHQPGSQLGLFLFKTNFEEDVLEKAQTNAIYLLHLFANPRFLVSPMSY
jgi:hypothetical protein